MIACPHCDTLHVRLDPGVRGRADCRCCGTVLYRRGWLSLDQWVALGWACLAVFAIAQWFPIVRLSIQGQDLSLTYWQALRLCWDRGYYGVSAMTGLAGFWFPLLQIALTLWVMQAIAARRLPPDLGPTLRLLGRLAPWSMATVLILAILSLIFLFGSYVVAVGPVLGVIALTFMELFVAFLQAYIFALLTAVFIGLIRHAH